MSAWNGWYHVEIHTHGTWLPGDERGWRSKHHRTHCEGDYKNPPPPGLHEKLLNRSLKSRKRDPVQLSSDRRATVGKAVVEMMAWQDLEIIALSMDSVHCHLLCKFPTEDVRSPVGRAKKHATFVLKKHGHDGPLWVAKCYVKPIADRSHQVTAFDYILDHKTVGAWTWTFREGVYWHPPGYRPPTK